MKNTTDSSAINNTLTALDQYVLLGNSGLRVSPLSLGCMVNDTERTFEPYPKLCGRLCVLTCPFLTFPLQDFWRAMGTFMLGQDIDLDLAQQH